MNTHPDVTPHRSSSYMTICHHAHSTCSDISTHTINNHHDLTPKTHTQADIQLSLQNMSTTIPQMDNTYDITDVLDQDLINSFNAVLKSSYTALAEEILFLPSNLLQLVSKTGCRTMYLTY
jgi:hypothetical protein